MKCLVLGEKIMNKNSILIMALGLSLLLISCSPNEANEQERLESRLEMNEEDFEPNVEIVTGETLESDWQLITPTEAKVIMDTIEEFILLDVRTEEEFKERRINGAFLIPYDEIKERANEELPNKNTTILIYCRSGRRSEAAAISLANLGYSRVYNFGGINDWPYETVSD
jgi:rhodanese-related sulfurtransferase